MADGICKLTGITGKLVKSHLIPQALTQPEFKGTPLIQVGNGKIPIRRWSSWYDSSIVTSDGEAILADLERFPFSWHSRIG